MSFPFLPFLKRVASLFLIAFALTPPLKAQDAKTNYKLYCAGCHGASMQGNSATALIKRNWTYGRGKGHLIRNITYGIEGTEMNGWNEYLTAEEIEALAGYIEEAQVTPLQAIMPLPERVKTEEYSLKVEQVVTEGLDSPWAIAFVHSQYALITERKGHIRILKDGVLQPEPVKGLPLPMQTRIGGLMGIAIDPQYASNGWIYLSMSHTSGDPFDEGAAGMTRIIRGRIHNNTWVDQEILFQVPDSMQVANGHRWGGPLLIDSNGYLYFTIGDLAEGPASQKKTKPHGKTYRIYTDGTVPEDNPFAQEAGAFPGIFTLGNRNSQGLAEHPETGAIWSTDHGPMGGDELNILRKGNNYGWPIVTYGKDYDGSTVSPRTQQEGMEQPVTYWTPSIAVSEAEFIEGPLFTKWENDLLVGALAYEEVRRIALDGDTVVEQEVILKSYGRIRDIEISPDGSIYLILNSPDKIVRLTPESHP